MEFNLGLLFIWYLVFIASITLHEAAHALVAYKLGDETAYEAGQVSLDPLPHIRREPLGTVVMPIVSYLWFHWMMGFAHIPLDPMWALRHPRRAALVSLAGPLANLLLVLMAGLAIRMGIWADVFTNPIQVNFTQVVISVDDTRFYANLATLLSVFFALNLLLFVFNLLPLPPLDGSSVIMLLMEEDTARRYLESFVWQPHVKLLGLLVAWWVMSPLVMPALALALNLLYPGAGYAVR